MRTRRWHYHSKDGQSQNCVIPSCGEAEGTSLRLSELLCQASQPPSPFWPLVQDW